MSSLLRIEDLSLSFNTRDGVVSALQNVSLSLDKGEIVGVVGESGSGKSVLAYTVMGLHDRAARILNGRIEFGGMDMLNASPFALNEVRGRELAMIFQSPRTALNPIRKIGLQIRDLLEHHTTIKRRDLHGEVIKALQRVRIPDPERRYHAYPFELSGGMCQRVMIAMALSCEPWLLIADEPTTGLDVTTQAVIMDLIRDMARQANMGALLITHDLSLAGEYCDRIAVMHAGHVVEIAPTDKLLTSPRHPYTERLLATTPTASSSIDDLEPITGQLPDLRADLPACRFQARCERQLDSCSASPLHWTPITDKHVVRCQNPL